MVREAKVVRREGAVHDWNDHRLTRIRWQFELIHHAHFAMLSSNPGESNFCRVAVNGSGMNDMNSCKDALTLDENSTAWAGETSDTAFSDSSLFHLDNNSLHVQLCGLMPTARGSRRAARPPPGIR